MVPQASWLLLLDEWHRYLHSTVSSDGGRPYGPCAHYFLWKGRNCLLELILEVARSQTKAFRSTNIFL